MCNSAKLVETFYPYVLVSAKNTDIKKKDKKKKLYKNDIDLLFMEIFNHDSNAY